jgi:hypothetical protein
LGLVMVRWRDGKLERRRLLGLEARQMLAVRQRRGPRMGASDCGTRRRLEASVVDAGTVRARRLAMKRVAVLAGSVDGLRVRCARKRLGACVVVDAEFLRVRNLCADWG